MTTVYLTELRPVPNPGFALNKLATKRRLKQIKPLFGEQTIVNEKRTEVFTDAIKYELSLNGNTLDISNSLQYIMREFAKTHPDTVILKNEYGSKSIFHTH